MNIHFNDNARLPMTHNMGQMPKYTIVVYRSLDKATFAYSGSYLSSDYDVIEVIKNYFGHSRFDSAIVSLGGFVNI